jgi:AcrR family transcriptional regulator
MPKITQAKRDARRQQILDAAVACFARDGFHNTTTADIVRESGVSQGTLYLYFEGKDDIIAALADDRHHAEAFVNALAQSEHDPVRGLLALIELHGHGLVDPGRRDMRRVAVQGWGEALRSERVHASVVEGLTTVRDEIALLIERGQRAGQIRAEVEPRAVAETLIAIFQGLSLQTALDETGDLAGCGHVIGEMIETALLTPLGRASWER